MSTYYKILPEDLNCKGFQYQEGLNIDTKEITPYKCDNGLHFSDAKHILHFYNYGSIIAEVELPEDAVVYHFDNKSKADKIILKNLRPLWNIETMEDLIQEGVEFDNHKGNMLLVASVRGYLDIVKYLIECGISAYGKNNALQNSSENGHLDVVKYLIEQGADIHANWDYALRYTSAQGHLDVVKCLMEHGANVHAFDDFALRMASLHGHLEIVKFLIDHGADIHAINDEALRSATKRGYFDMVELLIKNGANIHACEDLALQCASVHGRFEIVKLLIANGANPHARGGYAIRYAETPEIKAYLKSIK